MSLPFLLFFPGAVFPQFDKVYPSPTNPYIAATLGHRGFLQGHTFNLILLKPGLNRDYQSVFQAFEPSIALSGRAPPSDLPKDTHQSFHWSPDGNRLVLISGGWILAAWDFEHGVFGELRDGDREKLSREHTMLRTLFTGRFGQDTPLSNAEKRFFRTISQE